MRREVYVCSVICLSAWFVEAWTIADVRASLQLKASTEQQTTIKTILSATCDAVLYIDSDLRFMAPSPQLASMLLKCGGKNALLHPIFVDLVYSHVDERLLVEHMPPSSGQAVEKRPLAPMVQLSFKDSSGARVFCELFYAKCTSIDERTSFVVGVRELANEGRPVAPEIQPPGVADVASLSCLVATPPIGRADSVRSSASASSGTASVGSFETCSGMSSEMAINIDLMGQELDIVSATDAFSRIFGPFSLPLPLVKLIRKKREQERTIEHLFDLGKSWAEAGNSSGVELGLFHLLLCPPGTRLTYLTSGHVLGGPDIFTLTLVFREVKQAAMGPARASLARKKFLAAPGAGNVLSL
eukprot:TRINITY_DN35525_c0_g1_i1.p1 TRINITY_DN35525_c0_g1~~TRINITY_DN35525_c0_g1_i1.p1  ORF type:complete len:357 (-),score=65.25 TRINITY_DN35525_c0_g1_i1:85-1155(-)